MTPDNAHPAAPVQQLVWRLRDLLSKATPLPWEEVCASSRKHVCILEVAGGTRPGGQYTHPRRWKIVGNTRPHAATDQDANAAIIVAVINALPAMLDIVEVADAAMHLRNNGDPYGQMGRVFDQLTHALSLLPNAKPSGGPANGAARG